MSDHGLLTTVAYKMGKDEPACYALEVCDCLRSSFSFWTRFCSYILPPHCENVLRGVPWLVIFEPPGALMWSGFPLFLPGFSGHRRGSGTVAEGQHGHCAVVLRDRYLHCRICPNRNHAVVVLEWNSYCFLIIQWKKIRHICIWIKTLPPVVVLTVLFQRH